MIHTDTPSVSGHPNAMERVERIARTAKSHGRGLYEKVITIEGHPPEVSQLIANTFLKIAKIHYGTRDFTWWDGTPSNIASSMLGGDHDSPDTCEAAIIYMSGGPITKEKRELTALVSAVSNRALAGKMTILVFPEGHVESEWYSDALHSVLSKAGHIQFRRKQETTLVGYSL